MPPYKERRLNVTRHTLKMWKAQLHPVHRKTKVQLIMKIFSQSSTKDTKMAGISILVFQ